MGKRGPKPKGKVKIKWSANFAYAVGLIASDGCLSSDGRHVTFVSKDLEQIKNFLSALDIDTKIGQTFSGYKRSLAYRVQLGDVLFCEHLRSIGILPAKSKTLGKLEIPDEYFFDFLRGVFDGDGTIYSYWDKRWKSSFMFYISFASASKIFVEWLRLQINKHLECNGHMKKAQKSSTYQLTYAKEESLRILRKIYASSRSISLNRKKLKTKKILAIVGERLE